MLTSQIQAPNELSREGCPQERPWWWWAARVSSDGALKECQGWGSPGAQEKSWLLSVSRVFLQRLTWEDLGLQSKKSVGPSHAALSGGTPAPHESGAPTGWYWPSCRLWVKTAWRPPHWKGSLANICHLL